MRKFLLITTTVLGAVAFGMTDPTVARINASGSDHMTSPRLDRGSDLDGGMTLVPKQAEAGEDGYDRLPWAKQAEAGEDGYDRLPWAKQAEAGEDGYDRLPWAKQAEAGEDGYDRLPWAKQAEAGEDGYDRLPGAAMT